MEVLSPYRKFSKSEKKSKNTKRLWKLRIKITWSAIKKGMKLHHFHIICGSNTINHVSTVRRRRIQQEPAAKETTSRRRKPLASLLQLPYKAADFIDRGVPMSPAGSPRDNIASKWRELHGLYNWENLLDPLDSSLRREVIKYGEFVAATYDAFDADPLSDYYGSCRYNRHKIFQELGLNNHGYKVTKYIYAMSHVHVPHWFEKSHKIWSKDSNWIGFVAVSTDDESERIGRRDIVMAWRGTMAPTEWFMDLLAMQEEIEEGNVKVQHGFNSIYTSKSEFTRYNKLSASEQVMQEIKALVQLYRIRGEEISVTIIGHSLGGALALLNAREAALTLPENVTITVISFAAPRVGNLAFKNRISELGVKSLRIVVKQDVVPKLPGIVFNRVLHKMNVVTQKLNWVYRHVGIQLKLDVIMSPYLKKDGDLAGIHNLETYLHLLDGYFGKKMKHRWSAKRDLALVNKTSDMLIEELKVPEFWYQLPHKGLVFKYGRWVKPFRELEDIPSPSSIEISHHDFEA